MSLHLFHFADPISINYRTSLPTYFDVNSSTTYDVLLIRLLTSNLKITNIKTGKNISLDNNFVTFPLHRISRKSARPIKTLINPFTFQEFVRFSNKFYTRNLNFYHNLLQELVFYFSYSNDKQHVAAFVNLYRTVEYMSYSVPLMHSSHFGNYLGSFSALRSYFVNEKTSEVAFFENFVTRLFRGTPYLGLTTTFDFSHPDTTIANNCYNSFYALMKATDWISANPVAHFLEIENENLLSLIKNTRNRYFHFAIGGQRNLHVTDLADPDFFFDKINEAFLNWVTFIFATVMKENLSNAFY
jgi:hypothetical protein